MKGRKKPGLPGKIAAAMFAEDPDSIRVFLHDLPQVFGLTWAEVLADLRAGRLVAEKPDSMTLVDAFNAGEVWIKGSALIRWRVTRGLQ